MKRIISLIISASIFLQLVVPTASLVTYAAPGDGNLTWVEKEGLSLLDLKPRSSASSSTEAMVSWELDPEISDYTLKYVVEIGKELEEVTFKIKTDGKEKAKGEITVKGKDGAIEKEYKRYNVSSGKYGDVERAYPIATDIDIVSPYPGGAVEIGNMQIRFRVKDNNVYFHTNLIKHGYITPFVLKYGDLTEEVDVLTGIDGYQVSPIHIKDNPIGDKIENKETIKAPTVDQEEPGSKPGIRIDFKVPKELSLDGSEFKPTEDETMIGTLHIIDSTGGVGKKLEFKMTGGTITGEGIDDKELAYENEVGIEKYSLYLAQNDLVNGDVNRKIVKLEELNKSVTLDKIELSVSRKGNKNPALGKFSPQPEGKKGYTYLGYTIRRSNMAEAIIEVQPYDDIKDAKHSYIVKTSTDGKNWGGGELINYMHTSTGADVEEPFEIRIPFPSENLYYQITVSIDTVEMYSQVLHYNAKNDKTVKPPTPIIKRVENIRVVPPATLDGEPEIISFDLTWSAPEAGTKDKILDQLVKDGNLYYELFLHDSPEEDGILTKVFKVGLDDGKIGVHSYAGATGDKSPQDRHNVSQEEFAMESIVLKKPGEEGWEQVEIDGSATASNYKDIIKYPKVPKDTDLEPKPPKLEVTNKMQAKGVPGIYYVTMRAVYETTGSAITLGVSEMSNPKSITISPVKEVIPVPTKIESKNLLQDMDLDIISQSFSWGNVSIDRYIKQMLDPLKLKVGTDGKGLGVYEIYLYQKSNIPELDLEKTSPSAINLTFGKTYNLKNNQDENGEKNIDTLRKGGVIRLDYKGTSPLGMSNIIFEGLDSNQVYYAKIRVRLDVTGGPSVEERPSVFSKEYSFTSYVKPSEPGPGERVPPVPEKLKLIEQLNNTTAKIGWKAPDYTAQEGETLYYEMLRVEARTLSQKEESRIKSIPTLLEDDVKDEKEEMAGWRTKEPLVEKYARVSKSWLPASPDQSSAKLQLEDTGLNPNQIYYYYVRTVLVVEGAEAYSSWVGLPVTTDPVQRPIQLKVEDKETYAHDPKREIVVSFLAPIPKGSNVPADYDFDIAVQGEMDDEYKLKYPTRLTSTLDDKDIPTGYSHYVYKINALKSGKRYDIKVRVIDKVVDKVGGEYPKSLYSDRITARTHFDQDEQDKDDKFEEYLKYFEDKVEALRRMPYWTLEDGANTFSIKYRTNHITPEINSTKAYKLDVREGVSDFTYYMPASVIASANLNQTSFEIKQGDVTYSIRPSTITTELEELRLAINDIAEKYISDYYVVFNFSQRSNSNKKDRLTPEITVNIELARLRTEDIFLDDEMMVALNDRITSEKKRFIDDIEIALKRGKILDADLEVLSNRSVESIQSSHKRDVKSIVNRSTHRIISIQNWNKSMLIMATIEGNAVAEGYLLGWEDTALTTFNVGGGYGIEVTKSGTYGFKGQKINMPVILGVGGAGDLIGKYQLTDFFGTDGNIDPSKTVTKRNVLGAMARVLGAPRGADYIQYLKQKNIKGINNIGMDGAIKKGEGIYLLMQVHEKTHNKPINTVYVKNRNAVSNIRSFNQLHQPYVLVAVDSKIVSQGAIGPNDPMQIKDVLQVLSNIMATIR